MAYCNKCGAYIPEGIDRCFSCGYSEAAEQAAAAQAEAEAARKCKEDQRLEAERRRQAEERRARQQELNRKWAEAEQRRRNIEQEFHKRTQQGPTVLHRTGDKKETEKPSADAADGGKLLSVLSYVSFLCFLPGLMKVKDEDTRYHANQGKQLFAWSLVGGILGNIFSVGWAVTLARIALTMIGVRNAANGKKEPLPLIGDKKII